MWNSIRRAIHRILFGYDSISLVHKRAGEAFVQGFIHGLGLDYLPFRAIIRDQQMTAIRQSYRRSHQARTAIYRRP